MYCFDGNTFLKYNSVCSTYMQKIIHQEILIYHHFTPKYAEICDIVNSFFDALWMHPAGYEMTVIGQFYHFSVLFLVSITTWKALPEHGATTSASCSSNRYSTLSSIIMHHRSRFSSFLLRCPCRRNISAVSSRK